MPKFKTLFLEVHGEVVVVDEDLHFTLNDLADVFYSSGFGYVSRPGFDYFASSHPQENQVYVLALLAYQFNSDVGI